jgi:tetratricopeptide (TPR) repeat protein
LNKKVVLTLFPKSNWIVLVAATAFALLGGAYLQVAYLGFNLLLSFVLLKLAIGIHEAGHLLFATFAGATPRRMILGHGHKIVEGKYKGIKIVLNSNFNSGFAYASFKNLKSIRAKLLVYISGGFLSNFAIAGFFLLLADFSGFSKGIQLSTIVVLTNLFGGIAALVPHYFNYNGMRLYSDGLAILRIPFLKRSYLTDLASINEQLDAYDFFESRKYDEAITIYENLKSQNENLHMLNIYLSVAYLKKGAYERSVELLEACLPFIEDESLKAYKTHIDNGLAWTYLLQNRLAEADTYSERAYRIEPGSVNVKGTRGSVLIEMGRFEEGKNLLINDVDFSFPNNQTLGASIYLVLAFYKLEEKEKAQKYIAFIQENINLLDVDEKALFDRVMQKVQ